MKIGLLAYHSACNFGATLQLLSSYMYWKNAGHEPIVINWTAADLLKFYQEKVPIAQQELQVKIRKELWLETRTCLNAKDVADVITEEKIEAVVIGSDAVCQHHPLFERIVFPTKTLISIPHYTSDRTYPNVFWGEFNQYLSQPVPIVFLSASSQDSQYSLIPHHTKRQMAKSLMTFKYISVRDSWTEEMFRHLTKGKITPPITPDPVFAFSQNAEALIPSKSEILRRYSLPEKYFCVSFLTANTDMQNWAKVFSQLAHDKGIECVSLPFAHKESAIAFEREIKMPIPPIDWFAIIRYSCGYIGHNMHPIIVSLHNHVPFYSFDNYGIKKFRNIYVSDKSSKILHLLTTAGLEDCRISCISRDFTPPKPNYVLEKLIHFNTQKEISFAEKWYQAYLVNMKNIETSIGI